MSFVISSSVFLFSSLLNSSSLPPRWFLCLFHCLLFFLSIFLPAGLLVAAAASPVPAVEPFLFLWTAQSHTKVLCHLSLPLFFLFGNTSPPPFSWGHISVCTFPALGGSHLGGLRPGKGDNRNYTSTACIPRYSGNIRGHYGIVHTGWHGAGCPRGIGCSDNSPWSQGWAHPGRGYTDLVGRVIAYWRRNCGVGPLALIGVSIFVLTHLLVRGVIHRGLTVPART